MLRRELAEEAGEKGSAVELRIREIGEVEEEVEIGDAVRLLGLVDDRDAINGEDVLRDGRGSVASCSGVSSCA